MARKPAAAPRPTPANKLGVFVIYGPEEMRKREALDRVRAALLAAHGQTQTHQFDGKATPLADVLDELRSFSLMQQHKLVIVDDADVFVAAHREPLTRYAEAPVDSATLVFRSVKWNKGNIDKLIEKVGEVIKCDPMPPPQIPAWLVERARSAHQRTLDPRAAAALAQRMGGELALMDNELAKLAVMVKQSEAITVELVEQIVGRGSDEEAWVVQEPLLEALAKPGPRSADAAITKVHELVDLAGQPRELVTYFIADAVRKLYLGLMMRKQGVSDFQIAGDLKLWGPKRDAFLAVIRRIDQATVSRLFDRIVALDVRAKTGRGDPVRNLECFCVTLGDEST